MMKYRLLLLLMLLLVISLNCGCFRNLSVDGQSVRLQASGGIIFVKSNSTDKITQVWHRNLATGQETLLYDYGGYLAEPNPAIYPEHNTQIVLADKNSADDYDLYYYDLITKAKTSLTYNDSNDTDRHLSFDQAGNKLVFQSARSSKTKFYFVDITTATEPKTYDDDGGLVPVISPDGAKVAYIKEVKSSDDAEVTLKTLWVYDLTVTSSATNPKQITSTNNVENPAWDAKSETIAVETYVSSSGPRFIATIKPFDARPQLQQAVYSKNDDYRHPAWGVSGGRTILFFTGKLLTSDRRALGAVYYDEVLSRGSQAQWYLVASDSNRQLEEPCWAPDLEVTAVE
jgi:Tol biopolymer transport system component